MIETLTAFVEKNWARPYEVVTSLVGLLLIFGGFTEPLHIASQLLAGLDALTWSDALASANRWTMTHQLEGQSAWALLGVLAATAFAGLATPPTRSAGTYWLFAAIAVYGGSSLGDLIFSTVIGLAAGVAVDLIRDMKEVAAMGVVFRMVDVLLGAFWVPVGIGLWIFTPRRKKAVAG